jgi:hypothetical protein
MGFGAVASRSRRQRTTMVIVLGAPHVLGVVNAELLEVEVGLDADGLAWPDQEWVALFREYGSFPGDLEEPRLEHGKLRFEARDEDLERAWSEIKQRVAATNRSYEAILVPRDRTAQRSENARRDDVDDRVHHAQRLLDYLGSE